MLESQRILDDDLKIIRSYLEEKGKVSLLSLINIGINAGLKFSDLVQLRFENISNDEKITIKEARTDKVKTIIFNKTCQKAINDLRNYYSNLGFSTDKGYFFKSLSKYNVKFKLDKPITINGISQEFQKLQDILSIEYPITSHSLRKTWGYHFYKANRDILYLMREFKHTTAEQTLKYTGIEKKHIYKNYPMVEI